MEVIEDGNIMDRIPILLQRDFEYYQKNHTVLSETICRGVVGGRLDFPRNASFAAVKVVKWLEDEFSIAFQRGSGMFAATGEARAADAVAKTSDPDKFVQLTIKTCDLLLEHLHTLTQEALDHADLPVLTATLGAAALLRNSLHCFAQCVEDGGDAARHSALQGCYKQYATMSEALAERVLDLHNRVLSLYILQDSGGRPIDDVSHKVAESGSPSVQGWWLYMQGSRRDLWDTVPPGMAQRIFAGMLNETLTILNVRYCQAITTELRTPLYVNDILNILLCVAQLLPSICQTGSDLAGLEVQEQSRDVRDVHAKCNELFKAMVFRGAELHFIYQAFKKEDEEQPHLKDSLCPWYVFVSPHLFGNCEDSVSSTKDLPKETAIGLELLVLLAQPQPSWNLLVKVLTMRGCRLSRMLLAHALQHSTSQRWPASAQWFSERGAPGHCDGFLCTNDGFCRFAGDSSVEQELSRVSGALAHVLVACGSRAELRASLIAALETCPHWADCLDKRQVWSDRRPAWLAAVLGVAGSALRFVPPLLVRAVESGASMYQTMSLALTSISRTLGCIPRSLVTAAELLQHSLPGSCLPLGGSVLLQLLLAAVYEELQVYAEVEAAREKAEPGTNNISTTVKPKVKQVRIADQKSLSQTSFDATASTPSSIALAVAEALCSIDEDHKHTAELQALVQQSAVRVQLTNRFGLDEFPEFATFFEEGSVPAAKAERAPDAACLTSQVLMTSAGRDSLRVRLSQQMSGRNVLSVIYEHLRSHSARLCRQLGVAEPAAPGDRAPAHRPPLIYTMFHIGRRPFDQYLRGEWPMPWSRLVATAKAWSGVAGAKVYVTRRPDMRALKEAKSSNRMLVELSDVFKSCKATSFGK